MSRHDWEKDPVGSEHITLSEKWATVWVVNHDRSISIARLLERTVLDPDPEKKARFGRDIGWTAYADTPIYTHD